MYIHHLFIYAIASDENPAMRERLGVVWLLHYFFSLCSKVGRPLDLILHRSLSACNIERWEWPGDEANRFMHGYTIESWPCIQNGQLDGVIDLMIFP